MAPAVGAAEGKSPKSNGAVGGEDLFARPKVLRLKIELSEAAQESLRKEPKTYVKAVVREGDRSYPDIGVRLKGSGSFQSIDKKPSLSLKFDEFVKDQECHARNRILLNNALQDPTYLSEALGGEIFRAAGVPAAKVTFARIEINGRDLGLYVVAEAANKDFLSQHFKKAKGNLYEGSKNDVSDKLEKDGGDSSTDQADLRALAQAAKETDLTQRWKKLSALLDLERFISFAAVEVLVGHHDGYTMDRNNYRVYHDPASDQMVFLPHGLDQLFGKADEPLVPEWKGLIAKSVLNAPAGQQRYLERMANLLATAFKTDALQARINELSATIRPALAEASSGQTKEFDEAVAKLREHVARRAAFIDQQLKAQPATK
jgi:spore coat protein CotH